MKSITEYEIIKHGLECADFVTGCGIAGTEFTDVATGIGESEEEAFEDALDVLAQNGWDVEDIEKPTDLEDCPLDLLDCGPSWYISIRVR